jgi:hypothetical protein
LLPSPSLDPEVEYVVKIEVRQQRADTPALNCSYLTLYSLALFQHARLEPFLDQTHDAPVGYAVLDKLQSSSRLKDDDHSGGSVAMNSTNSRSVGAAQLEAWRSRISNCRHAP